MIVEHIAQDLVEDRVVSVRRFGTLSPHLRRGHLAFNLSSGKVRRLSDYRSVKFHPHEFFSTLLADREDRFRGESS